MATTLPPSAYSSRRNSIHRDDQADRKGRSRRASIKNSSFPHPHDDKIAIQDSSALAASQDADSMKYPVLQPSSNISFDDPFANASFGDFGKSLIDDDYLKGFGLSGMPPAVGTSPGSKTTSRNPSRAHSRGHSRGASQAPEPLLSVPSHSVYELDVPHAAYPTNSTPERGGRRPSEHRTPSRGTPKQSAEMARLKTPELVAQSSYGMRKGSGSAAKASPESPVKEGKVKRLSGFSLRSVKSAFSRNDYPEVVQPSSPTRQPRNGSVPVIPRVPDPNTRGADPHREYAMPSPLDSMIHQSQSTYRQPRAMASTPQLHQQVPPTPAVPRPWMTRRPSASSLRSTVSNINKPLPPEPGQRPSENYNPARTPTTPARPPPTPSSRTPNHPQSRTPVGPPPPRPWQEQPNGHIDAQSSRMSRRANTAPSQPPQLRSKYAKVKDLDALDANFVGSRPAPNSAGLYGGTFVTEMSPRDQLDPIRESPAASKSQLDINAPLQISRGPNHMVPSRKPPPTPGSRSRSPVSIARSKPATPEPPKQPAQPQHVATQSVQTSRRPSAARADSSTLHLGGGPTKVQQLLGESDGPSEPISSQEFAMERKVSVAPVSRFEADENQEPAQQPHSPQAQQLILGPLSNVANQSAVVGDSSMARTESFSSHTSAFRTGTSDVQYYEIRRRLELLSPTTIADTSFMPQVFGQMLSTTVASAEPVQAEQELTVQAEPQIAAAAFVEELPGDTVRIKSMMPVELPADANWAMSLAELHEMAGSASPRVSVQPATPMPFTDMVPPPIPESPKRDSRRTHSHTQSMLSSGSGRTKSIRSIKSARSARSAKARSISSAAASEIPELYAGLPSPRTTLASRRTSARFEEEDIPELPPMPEIATTEELEEMDVISADTAEQVLYQILRNLLQPNDLFNASLVSRGFQRTFRRHDTKLLRNALWYSSPPAWEYLEMHMPISENGHLEYPPDVYRQQWMYSMSCLAKLKAMILHHCGRSLSPITALMLDSKDSKHSAPVDDAIWRIWTFCKIFGEDEDRREDLELQKQWIKGQTILEAQVRGLASSAISAQAFPAFGFGNDEGLSPEELMRMGEIWLCLRVLVRGYRGQRHEAREFGIFEGADVPRGDAMRENALLDEWTIHLLSQAPGTNLKVLCPQTATQENFITAESLGFTSWTPPGRNFTSSGFLTGPICSVLEEWLTSEGRNARASHNSAVHPAFRTQQAFPSRQQVGLFVDRLRTVKDVLVSPRPDQKPTMDESINTVVVKQPHLKPAKASKPAPVAVDTVPMTPKTPKESSKKFGFSSKMSLRLPSRSHTTANKTKPPPTQQVPKTPATATHAPPAPAPAPAPAVPVEATKESGFFSRSKSLNQRTRIFLRNPTGRRRGIDTDLLTTNPVPDLPTPQGSRGDQSTNEKSRRGSQIAGYNSSQGFPDQSDAAAGRDATDPHVIARTQLIAQGYDASRVEEAICECLTANGVDVDKALKKLKKSRKLEDRLKRLDRMG